MLLFVIALAPTIRSEPTEQKVVEGSNITIPCGVEGKPKPRVVWYKGDQLLGGGRYQVLPNGDLQMKVHQFVQLPGFFWSFFFSIPQLEFLVLVRYLCMRLFSHH